MELSPITLCTIHGFYNRSTYNLEHLMTMVSDKAALWSQLYNCVAWCYLLFLLKAKLGLHPEKNSKNFSILSKTLYLLTLKFRKAKLNMNEQIHFLTKSYTWTTDLEMAILALDLTLNFQYHYSFVRVYLKCHKT